MVCQTGTLPRTASRRLLELSQTRLTTAPANASLSVLLHLVQQDYVALSANTALCGMASTLVGVCLIGNAAAIFNVGDSRAYLVNGGQAQLMSRDHSLLDDMLTEGEITPEQAGSAARILRGLTCQFIADAEFNEFKVNIVNHVLLPDERLLLCSDGLIEVLSDAEIAALLVGHSDDALLNACKASRRVGGTDDFSVIVLTLQD